MQINITRKEYRTMRPFIFAEPQPGAREPRRTEEPGSGISWESFFRISGI